MVLRCLCHESLLQNPCSQNHKGNIAQVAYSDLKGATRDWSGRRPITPADPSTGLDLEQNNFPTRDGGHDLSLKILSSAGELSRMVTLSICNLPSRRKLL